MQWFKNLRIYRLTKPIRFTPETIGEKLSQHEFQPCGNLDPVKYGWTLPLGRHGSEFVHAANDNILIAAKRQEKIIPGALIKEQLEDRLQEIRDEESRFVGRAERQTLKDEIIFSLLPKALTKSSFDFAYIDKQNALLVVNTSSAKRAEELISALRESLGSLKLVPFTVQKTPAHVMTDWLRNGKINKRFELGEECELQAAKDGRVIRCKKQDLTAHEILNHLESGMLVSKVAITWNEAISCIIDDQLGIKRIKYEDAIQEKVKEYDADSAVEQMDIDFSIMTVELAAFINDLAKAFGGQAEDPEEF